MVVPELKVMTRGPLILVIDDNADHVLIQSTLLGYHGYDVISAPDTAEGLRLARLRRPALILLDLHYGGAPLGLAALRDLAGDPLTADIPVIINTAFADLYRRELALERVRIVQKDFSPEALLEAVREILPPPDAA
jgi:CheY-like chemotaxis protein